VNALGEGVSSHAGHAISEVRRPLAYFIIPTSLADVGCQRRRSLSLATVDRATSYQLAGLSWLRLAWTANLLRAARHASLV
jgi:hypothetical protein